MCIGSGNFDRLSTYLSASEIPGAYTTCFDKNMVWAAPESLC